MRPGRADRLGDGQPFFPRSDDSRTLPALRPYNPHHLALAPGTRLGVYELTAQIGEGGMGQVYRATDTTLGRQVAIKILRTHLPLTPIVSRGSNVRRRRSPR